MAKKNARRLRWGMAGPEYGWRPWRVGARTTPPPASPPAAPPAPAEPKSKAGTVVLIVLGLGVVTFAALELTGVTHVLVGPPKPALPLPPGAKPAGPTAAAPAAGAAAAPPSPVPTTTP